MTLTEFLLDRIAYDEELAECVDPGYYWGRGSLRDRMLAECEAKRRIVRLHTVASESPELDSMPWQFTKRALAALALPYADHPDYRQEWKP